jgi:hypothetical protein
MRTEIRNGQVAVINETREESIETLNDFLEELGIEPLTEKELRDWDIRGGETNFQLKEWARDYASECHTEKCSSKKTRSYQF